MIRLIGRPRPKAKNTSFSNPCFTLQDDPKAKEQFQQLSDAYQILSDADAKSAYDNVLKVVRVTTFGANSHRSGQRKHSIWSTRNWLMNDMIISYR